MSKNAKNREWEKDRRDRLNKAFTILSKLLPSYDPSKILSKIDILTQASTFIQELQVKIEGFINDSQTLSTEKLEIKKLTERIKKLLERNDQLCHFIRDAGIKIPKEYGSIKNISSKLIWSNKITCEQAKKRTKKQLQENITNNGKINSKNKIFKNRQSKVNQKDSKKTRLKIKNRKVLSQRQNLSIPMPVLSSTNRNINLGQCYMVTNTPSVNLGTTKIIVKNGIPKSNTKSKSLPKSISDKVLNILGPGTLILSNGTVIPILPPTQKIVHTATVLANTTQVIVNPSVSITTTAPAVSSTKNENLVSTVSNSIISNVSTLNNTKGKALPLLRPKRCVTKTTQINKVPIPALSSRYSSYNFLKFQNQKNNISLSPCNKKAVKNKNLNSVRSNETKKLIETADVTEGKRKAENEAGNENKKVKTDENKVKVNKEQVLEGDPKQDPTVTNNKTTDVEYNNEGIELSVENTSNKNSEDKAVESSKTTNENIKNNDSCSTEPKLVQSNKIVQESLKSVSNLECSESHFTTNNPTDNKNVLTESQEIKNKEISKSNVNSECEISGIKTCESGDKDDLLPQKKSTDKSFMTLDRSLYHSDLSNDIFSSLQVPLGSQNQESTSPTAAFLLAFPLVSTLTGVKVTEVIDEENSDSRHGTPTLLQIGTMDSTKTSQTVPSESLTPSLLNLDNFSFFSTKDSCGSFYSSFDNVTYTCSTATMTYSSYTTASPISSVVTSAFSDKNVVKSVSELVKVNSDEKEGKNSNSVAKEKTSRNNFLVTQNSQTLLKNLDNTVSKATSIYHATEKNTTDSNKINLPNSSNSFNSSASTVLEKNNPLSSSETNNTTTSISSISTLTNSTSFVTSLNTYNYKNESNCKIKVDPTSKQSSALAYSQSNYNDISNKDAQLSKQPISISGAATTINNTVNCNFSEKTFLEQKPQTNYNIKAVSASNCDTFNPFADKLSHDYNVNYPKSYSNMLYNNTSSYNRNYSGETNSYLNSYTSDKTSDSYNNQKSALDQYNQHKGNVDNYRQQKGVSDSYSQQKLVPESYNQPKSLSEPYIQEKLAPDTFSQQKIVPDNYSQHKSVSEPYSQPKIVSELFNQQKTVSELYSQQKNVPDSFNKPKPLSESYIQQKSVSEPYNQQKVVPETYSQQKSVSEPYGQQKIVSEPYNHQKSVSESYRQHKIVSETFNQQKPLSESYVQQKSSSEPYNQQKIVAETYSQQKSVSEPYSQQKIVTEPYNQQKSVSESYSQQKIVPETFNQQKPLSEPYVQQKLGPETFNQQKNISEPYSQQKLISETYSQQKPLPDSYNQQKNISESYQQKSAPEPYNQQIPNCKTVDICKRESTNHIQNSNNSYFRQTAVVSHKEKINLNTSKNVKSNSENQPKPPINWMTTPDLKQEAAFPPSVSFVKEVDYASNNFYPSTSFTRSSHVPCFNSNAPIYQTPEFPNTSADNKKTSENIFPILPQRNEFEENQFSWSPTKLQFFDASHSFVSSTLPTLVGDLALGTIQQPPQLQEQIKIPIEKEVHKHKDNSRRSKQQNYDHSNNHSNFLSVSQLVEKATDCTPGRISSRRNSGSRSNKNSVTSKSIRRTQKQMENKECTDRVNRNYSQNKVEVSSGRRENIKAPSQRNQNLNYGFDNPTWFDYNKNQRQEPNKHPQSIYSAEALLGHQTHQNNTMFRQQHSNFTTNFLSDNIMPYFSTVELQDNNFIPQNQNFQNTALAHNFSSTVQSYTYLSNNQLTSTSNLSSSYLPTTSFMSDLNSQDYNSSVQNKNFPKQNSIGLSAMQNIVSNNNDCAVVYSTNYPKKSSKMKQNSENSLPGIDFSFLPMPGTISSPMLPDDFHVHTNFLPPPPTSGQLYPCKNSTYNKQTANEPPPASMIPLPPLGSSKNQVQSADTPTNINSMGTSLTNFNLSTIFPEINKGTSFPSSTTCQRSSKNKDYSTQKNCYHRSGQVPFQNKPSNYGISVPHTKVNN